MEEHKIIAEDKMKGYIDALRRGYSYDYISEHGYGMSKTELIDIIKELDYAIHKEIKYAVQDSEVYNSAADELAEIYMEG